MIPDDKKKSRLLASYGYPPDKSKFAVDLVMQQARAMCEHHI